MDRHLSPDIRNRVYIRDFVWPVLDPHVLMFGKSHNGPWLVYVCVVVFLFFFFFFLGGGGGWRGGGWGGDGIILNQDKLLRKVPRARDRKVPRARDFAWTPVGKLAGSWGPQQWLALSLAPEGNGAPYYDGWHHIAICLLHTSINISPPFTPENSNPTPIVI